MQMVEEEAQLEIVQWIQGKSQHTAGDLAARYAPSKHLKAMRELHQIGRMFHSAAIGGKPPQMTIFQAAEFWLNKYAVKDGGSSENTDA